MNQIFGLPEELRSGKSQGFKKSLKLIQSGKQFTDIEYNDFFRSGTLSNIIPT